MHYKKLLGSSIYTLGSIVVSLTSSTSLYSALPKASQSAFNQNHLEQKMFQPNMESKHNHIPAIKILSS
jgi:hypothetical protein